MLIIRKQQIQQFIARNDRELLDVVRQAVRKANGERVVGYSDDELNKMIPIGIARAKSHRLTGAEDIAAFVAIMFEIAPRFDEHPEIAAVLSDPQFTPDQNFKLLFQRVTPQTWVNAGRLYDDSFWFPDGSIR